jgi:pyruvate/2-oxoglutarate dehydrogenase complex dihydrolipoamide acyltransferase (E2) component
MTLHEIRIPKLGMETTDCEVKSWRVAVGDRVAPGQELLEVETEKADVVIEAEVAGVVRDIDAAVGERVDVGAVVGTIEVA